MWKWQGLPSLAARYLKKKTRRFFDYVRAPPFLFRRVNEDGSKQAPRIKEIGLIENVSRVDPKKGEHPPGK